MSTSPDAHYPDEHNLPPPTRETPSPEPVKSPLYPITRTVAIIKTHALHHRFDIERRIQEASFEIVKERQMEFDTETDPDTLYEVFGEDAESLAEGPVWVYVLERRRAVEVWNTLMGDRDPEFSRAEAPNSLRALYGNSLAQNGLMGSPDTQTAEIQISALFASSPPFPTTELPDDRYGSMRSVSSSFLSNVRNTVADEGYARSSGSTLNGSTSKDVNGKVLFRARPVPATNDKPDIVPRTTRAAALRAGLVVDKVPAAPRGPVSKERLAQTFANVPGHKRSETISVASTAAPAIAPRMTRAASLRLGQTPAPPVIRKRAVTNGETTKLTFEGVPGHKRRESIAVASVKAPTVAPRLNKSAALRVQKEQAPPTSFMFRAPSAPKLPGLSRTSSSDALSSENQPPPRPASQASTSVAPSRYPAVPRASSVAAIRPIPQQAPRASTSLSKATGDKAIAPIKPRPRPSSVGAPTIAPRTNRSAALRAAKQETENVAAAATLAKKGPRPSKVAPSSFKSVAI